MARSGNCCCYDLEIIATRPFVATASQNETSSRMIAAQANLEYCPVDILLEVMHYLDLKDVLRLREVSQRMAAFTRSRPVWDRLMTVSDAAVLLRKRRPLCSSKELEDVVVQQATSEAKLRKGGKWLCERTHRLKDHWVCCLLPGGRWLLDTTKHLRSGIRYADLDSAEPQWRQLIPPLSDRVSFSLSCVEHVAGAPALTIHVALAVHREIPPKKNSQDGRRFYIDEISIWRVLPAYDDDGTITGLQAERICVFSHRPPHGRYLQSMKLQGQNLIFVFEEPPWICSVIRWVDANGCDDNFPRKVITFPRCERGQLITEDVLLVGTIQGQVLSLWDLSEVSLSQSYTGSSVCTTPKWESQPTGHRLDLVPPPWPPPQVVNNVAFQLVPQSNGMLLLTVPFPLGYDTPTLSSRESSSVILADAPNYFTLSRGEVAYIPPYMAEGPPPTFRLHYRDDVDNPASFSLPLREPVLKPYLDAYSPRLLLLGPYGTYFHQCCLAK